MIPLSLPRTRLPLVGLVVTFSLLGACGGDVCTEEYITTHPDLDGDGFGDASKPERTCGLEGRVTNSSDCDDTDELSFMGAEEVCDGRDNDCDGQIDQGLALQVWYADTDGDGFGAGAASEETCLPPANYVGTGDDCDDIDPNVNPSMSEVCDDIDNDCDGLTDDDDDSLDLTTQTTFYRDSDGDTYGDAYMPLEACTAPNNASANFDDCDDTISAVNPGAAELCNTRDDNCNGLTDEEDPGIDPALLTTRYDDVDGDGFGDPNTAHDTCFAEDGVVDNADDCDDSDFTLGPPADWFADGDGDGYGSGTAQEYQSCVPSDPTLVPDTQGLDCDDTLPGVYPGATEVCGDGIDSNCDSFDCDDWLEDFESGTMSVEWRYAGNADWTTQVSDVYEGGFASKNMNISDNQTASMILDAEFIAAGSVSFWHSGSTESGWDFLRFYVDGAQQDQWSGTWAWANATYPVSAGAHTLEWRYYKDGSVSGGADTVYVDYIELTSGVAL